VQLAGWVGWFGLDGRAGARAGVDMYWVGEVEELLRYGEAYALALGGC